MSAALAGHSPGQVHGERVEVDVLNIDVAVLDDAGRPITGLDEARFRVRLDGQPQEIDYFAEIRNGSRAADEPGPATAAELPIRLLVFVDESTLRSRSRNDALAELDRQLSTLPQPPVFALYSFDGRHLHELQPWTRSRQQMHLAMANASRRESPFSRLDLQRRTRREAVGCRGRQEVVIDEARRGSEAAVAALDIAGAPSVRGAMVVVAGSWPASVPRCGEHEGNRMELPSEGRASPLDLPEPFDAEARLWSAYRLLTDEVARRQWVLFPWDGSGFVPDLQSIDVETVPGAGEGTGTAGRVAGDEQRLHGLLDSLARETGGQALLNAEVDRFATVLAASMTSYYSLGLTWGRDRWNPEASLEIDVRVEGARTLHRKAVPGPLSTEEAVRLALVATLLSPENVPRELALELGDPERGDAMASRPLSVRIPLSRFPRPVDNGPFRTELQLYLLAMDGEGATSPLVEVEEPIVVSGSIPPEAGDFFLYETEIRLRGTTSRLAVAVREPVGGAVLRGVVGLVD